MHQLVNKQNFDNIKMHSTNVKKDKDNSPIRRSVNKDQRYEGTVTSCFHLDKKEADSSEILVHSVTFHKIIMLVLTTMST